MCDREREWNLTVYRCTSPQLIALCVGVSPLYSTPDKMCVSVHGACYGERPLGQTGVYVCIVCVTLHLMLYLFHRIFDKITEKRKKIVFGLKKKKSSNKPCNFGEQYCSAWCTRLCKIDHSTTFTSGPQNTSTVAMQTMTTEIWYQILNGFYRKTLFTIKTFVSGSFCNLKFYLKRTKQKHGRICVLVQH